MKLTDEQTAAIQSRGKVIVSASAGSGKTFVMIEKLVNAVADGADLDEILAVTFTKKAAAQMKEKLRAALIKRLETAGDNRERIKFQLSKISTANVSTIHSFCARLLRTYFYALGIDGTFDVISADDAEAQELKSRALETVFERRYQEGGEEFKHLLNCFMKKRNDYSLKLLLLEAHSRVRSVANYENLLKDAENLYTDEGFNKVIEDIVQTQSPKFDRLICAVERFKERFPATKKAEVYNKIFNEMVCALKIAKGLSPFAAKPALTITRKPADCDEDKPAGEEFKRFKDGVSKRYSALCGDFESEQTERERFLKSGFTATAFSRLLTEFDREYAAVKAEENKLDYNDLEHFTLRLLENEQIKDEINRDYNYVFVDEYQDVNPVQEKIISSFTGETFLVGDVKQAIYGFRGSKSVFFSRKFEAFGGSGNALKLSTNFRSGGNILDFVNAAFSEIMRQETCGIDYEKDAKMRFGGLYPEGYGGASISIFGKEQEENEPLGVYSVRADGRKSKHSREGLAVLEIVEKELCGKHFDLQTGEYRDNQLGDICILTRKNKGASTEGIVRALTDEGYSVSGAQEANICALPEVKQMLDVLSLVDNAEQDAPLVAALISPLGGLCEDELAQIRIVADAKPRYIGGVKQKKSFKECCAEYALCDNPLAKKLNLFWQKLEDLRSLSGVVGTGELIDELLENYGFETSYGADGENKVKNVLRLAQEGATLTLAAFLAKIKAGGYDISAPAPAPSNSIKIMSMHASKGLEFPVVIIADICKTFKGADYEEMPFDESYGFAPKCFDTENMFAYKTALRRLAKIRAEDEELKNELNLFYVACTRAMCSLHILAEEQKPFGGDLGDAKCYADLFDISKFPHGEINLRPDFTAESVSAAILPEPDPAAVESIRQRFMQPYANAQSVDLPVKSSASAILRLYGDEPYFAERKLFGGEGETGTERGTAYHRFLELCDFNKKTEEEILQEIENFVASGRLDRAQADLLNAKELSQILNMPVFSDLADSVLFREQEFTCMLPANSILETPATDKVLVQGAIDLLAQGDFGWKIIDYKYSHKTDEALIKTYARQLGLYKKAVSLITGAAEKEIKTVIVNLFLRRQINLD